MFKINVSVGHLHDFLDFMWRKIEQNYDSTQSITRLVLLC